MAKQRFVTLGLSDSGTLRVVVSIGAGQNDTQPLVSTS
jgi:hypothetical protein